MEPAVIDSKVAVIRGVENADAVVLKGLSGVEGLHRDNVAAGGDNGEPRFGLFEVGGPTGLF